MSDSILNDSLPTDPHEPYKRIPAESVGIQGDPNGRTRAFRHSSHDLTNFNVNLIDLSTTERDTIVDFYREHYGAYDTFLWKDPSDYTIDTYTAIAAWGAENDFQLLSTYGSETVNRYNIVAASEVIKYAGVLKTKDVDYTLDYTDDGSVVFVNDPGAAEAVTAAAEFYRRVRFVKGSFSDSEKTNSLADVKFTLIEVIPDGV